MRFDRWELGGALGDAGVLFPLAAALIALNGLNATAVFLVPGLLYVAAGLYYRLPVPVQPLKAASAIALALGLGPGVLGAGALWMGLALLALSATGLADRLARLFSRPLVRGVQLGIGLLLVKAAWGLLAGPLLAGPGAPGGGPPQPASLAVGGVAFLLLLALPPGRRVPASVAVLGAGFALGAAVAAAAGGLPPLSLGPAGLHPRLPAPGDWAVALTALVIPQLPLTLANAVVATADAARAYFGDRAARVTPRALAAGLGLANCLAGVLQGMPVCHGAGGLTAHHRFGARTGGAVVITGALCLLLALVLGHAAPVLLGLVPLPVLGAFLALVGLEHAALASDLRGRQEHLVALGTGAVAAATANMLYGLAAGVLLQAALRVAGPAGGTLSARPPTAAAGAGREAALTCEATPALGGSARAVR